MLVPGFIASIVARRLTKKLYRKGLKVIITTCIKIYVSEVFSFVFHHCDGVLFPTIPGLKAAKM